MGKLILGFIAGYILSDMLTAKFPQAGRFKIQALPQIGVSATGTTVQSSLPSAALSACAYPTLLQQ
jgi:hypothetical protein